MSIDLPPEIAQLSTALGLGDGSSFDLGFLEDPVGALTGMLRNEQQRTALLELLTGLLGTSTERFDLPGVPPGEDWLPLVEEGAGGLYLVTEVSGAGASAVTKLSIAGRLRRVGDGVDARASVRVPLLRVSATDIEPLVGGPDGAIAIAVRLQGEAGPLLDVDGFAAEGLALRVSIATDPHAVEPASVGVVVEGLRFAAGETPEDLDLIDLAQNIDTGAVRLLLAALRARAGAPPALHSLLAMLGLGPSGPIPTLPLLELLTDAEATVRAWARQLLVDRDARAAWLAELGSIFGITVAPGTTELVLVDAGSTSVRLALDVDTDDATGAPRVRVKLAARHAQSGGAVHGALEAAAELVQVVLSEPVVVIPMPELHVGVRLTGAPAADGSIAPLVVSPNVDGHAVRVGALLVGVALTPARDVVPTVRAEDVQVDTATFATLDLTDADAVVGAATDVVESAVADLLGTLTDLLGVSDQARALAALIGLVPPPGDPWAPALVDVLGLIDDPLRAVAAYHARVLAQPAAWPRLLAQVGALIDGAPALAVPPGAGTVDDPWRLVRTSGAVGGLTVVAWHELVDGATHLRVGLRGTLHGDVEDARIEVAITSELLDIRLPDAPTTVDVTVARCHTLTLTVGDDLRMSLGSARVAIERATVGVRWCRGGAPEPLVAIRGITVRDGSSATPIALPDLDGSALDLLDLAADADVLRVLGRLLGVWLAGGSGFGAGLGSLLGLLPGLGGGGGLDGLADLLGGLFGGAGRGPWPNASIPGLETLVGGSGTHADPWHITGLPDGVPTPLQWLDPAGPPQLEDLVPRGVFPPVLRDALAGTGSPLAPDRVAAVVRRLSRVVPNLADALGGDVAAALTALRDQLADTDGLIPAAAQAPDGWVTVEQTGTSHLTEPADVDLAALGAAVGPTAGWVLVSGPLPWASPWTDADPSRVIDLRDAGRDAATFDLDHVTGAGPWHVLLPARADAVSPSSPDGLEGLRDRLRRAVDAVRSASGGAVTLVAHGTAGHAARLVASQAGAVDRVVTVGTPHVTVSADWLIDDALRNAVRLLQRLRAQGTAAPSGRLADVLRTLEAALDGIVERTEAGDTIREHLPFPFEDLTVPASWPALAGGVTATAVVCRVLPAEVDQLLTELLGRAVEAIATTDPAPTLPTHAGYGLRAALHRDTAVPGEVVVHADARLDIALTELTAAPHRAVPRLTIEVELSRAGGWLVSPAELGLGQRQDPRVRSARLELTVELGEAGPAGPTAAPRIRARVVLRDVSVLGRWHESWVVDDSTMASLGADASGPTGTLPEVRMLLAEVAAALGTIPADGALAAVAQLLTALDAARATAEGGIELVTDGLEQLLRAPDQLLADLTAAAPKMDALLDAIAALGGGHRAPGLLVLTGGGPVEVALVGTAPAWSIRVRTTAPMALGDVATLAFDATIAPSGRVTATAAVVASGLDLGPAGNPRLSLGLDSTSADPVTLRLGTDGADGLMLPDVTLLPTVDTASLAALLQTVLPGELLRLALTWARGQAPAVIDPLLSVLGLLAPVGATVPVRSLTGLVADPLAWLSSTVSMGMAGAQQRLDPDRLVALVDALAAWTGTTGAAAGTLALPGGVVLQASTSPDGRAVVSATTSMLAAGAAGVSGSVSLLIGAGLDLAVEVDGSVTIAGVDGLDGARLQLGGGAAGPRLTVAVTPLGGTELALPLLPPATWGQLTQLADAAVGAAVQQLLPLALDALAGEVPAVGQLGDAFAVRSAGAFDGAALVALGQDPGSVLRNGTLVGAIASAAEALLDAVGVATGPSATIPRVLIATPTPNTATVELVLHANVTVEVTLGATPGVCVTLTEFEPVAGLAISGTVCVDTTGVPGAAAQVAVVSTALIGTDPVVLLPFVRFELGTEAPVGDRLVAGLFDAPSDDTARHGLGVTISTGGSVDGVCLDADGNTEPITPACAGQFALGLLLPLVGDLVLEADAVVALLDRNLLSRSALLRTVLTQAEVLDHTDADGYSLAEGLFDDLAGFGLRMLRVGVQAASALVGDALGDSLGGLVLTPVSEDASERTWYGLRISLDEAFVLADGDDVRLELDGYRGPFGDGDAPGLTLFVVSHPSHPPSAASDIMVSPRIAANDIGLRLTGAGGGPLLADPIGILAAGIFASYDGQVTFGGDGSVDGWDSTGGGARVSIRQLSLPLGGGGDDGGNPVAQKMLSQASENESAGDAEEVGFTVELELEIDETGVEVHVGVGDPPWWIPVQRSFGPLYVGQVGVLVDPVRDPSRIGVLFDGGIEVGGLAVGLDDLSLIYDIEAERFTIGLAGLAIAYSGDGLTLAGGLRHHDGEYLGMLELRFQTIGLTVLGGWGEHPVSEGSSETYTAMFVFGALSASIGGPPPFFLTGIGAGMGINRRLILPDTVEGVIEHPLVQAMDPSSSLARNPMGALEELGKTFPPHRGTFWFAAGIRFTSFVLVESIAVLSVEVGDGVEVGLLGLSRMLLPNAAAPLVSVELALRARFSSREGVLSIQAQLTDNSWLLDDSCRLTGGFAFVVWFRTGQFVLTLGGYHPRFDRPADFPDVPRLGFSWTVSDAITIKGGLYFALTSSAVMVGGSLEASYRTSWAWASFELGANALVMWDPLAYDFEVYIRVSAGVRIRICIPLLGCATIGFSFSIGARVHVYGPKFRGTATLDLDVVTLTVHFGADSSAAEDQGLTWNEFRPKYLTAGDTSGLESSLGTGRYVPPGASDAEVEDSVDGPWVVLPEWSARVTTTTASNHFQDVPVAGVDAIDLGPMRREEAVTKLRVRVERVDGPPNVPGVKMFPRLGQLPAALWTSIEASTDAPPAAELVTAVVGADIVVTADLGDASGDIPVNQVTDGRLVHPLPLGLSRGWRGDLDQLVRAAGKLRLWAADRSAADAAAVLLDNPTLLASNDGGRWRLVTVGTPQGAELAAPELLSQSATGMLASADDQLVSGLLTAHRRTGATTLLNRAAPPRVRSLGGGTNPPQPVAVELREVAAPEVVVDATRTRMPRLDAVLHEVVQERVGVLATSVGRDAAELPRVPAPSLAAVQAATAASVGARLHLRGAGANAGAEAGQGAQGDRPVTAVAGERHEWRAADPRLAQPVAIAMRAMRDEAADSGTAVHAGDTQIWAMPDRGRARDGGAVQVHIKGSLDVRVVALSRSGRPLMDVTTTSGAVTLPASTSRVAVAGTAGGGEGLAGWHAGTRLVRVSRTTALAPHATVRTEASDSRRRGRQISAGLVPAADLIPIRGSVDTVLPIGTRTVVVGLAPLTADADPNGFSLRLSGAVQTEGEARMVRVGARVHAMFDVTPIEGARSIRAHVEVDEGWQLVAVVGAAAAASTVATWVTRGDLERRLRGIASSSTASSSVRLSVVTSQDPS